MTLHLIKLSVGPEELADLEHWQAQYLRQRKRLGQKPELMHVTRQMPKRAEELRDGGSIYWVIKGLLCARQQLLELRPVERDGVPHCALILDPELVRVSPRPHRPFQGWRYLQAKDAPADLLAGQVDEDMPESMRRQLAELGLL